MLPSARRLAQVIPLVATTHLCAEGGAPQYAKRNAILRDAEVVGEGSVMLHIDSLLSVDDGEEPLDYQPGHVLALEIEENNSGTTDEKTAQDVQSNGGWMRGPYTVSRATENSLDILLKVVGKKSEAFASAKPGTPLKFGGKFKVPIVEGIIAASSSSTETSTTTKRVVLISTGVGIGPCVGAVEKLLSEDDFSGKVDLFASFRTQPEVIYDEYLNGLMMTDQQNEFRWKPWITSDMGRISASDDNVRMVVASQDDAGICSLTETHYHLIGNGQMVNEWKAGLAQAGVLEEKVTTEAYFNHKAESNQDAITRIASVIAEAALSPVA